MYYFTILLKISTFKTVFYFLYHLVNVRCTRIIDNIYLLSFSAKFMHTSRQGMLLAIFIIIPKCVHHYSINVYGLFCLVAIIVAF